MEGNLSEWEGGRTYLSSQIRLVPGTMNLCTKLQDSPFNRYFHLDKCETDKPTLLILAILLAWWLTSLYIHCCWWGFSSCGTVLSWPPSGCEMWLSVTGARMELGLTGCLSTADTESLRHHTASQADSKPSQFNVSWHLSVSHHSSFFGLSGSGEGRDRGAEYWFEP